MGKVLGCWAEGQGWGLLKKNKYNDGVPFIKCRSFFLQAYLWPKCFIFTSSLVHKMHPAYHDVVLNTEDVMRSHVSYWWLLYADNLQAMLQCRILHHHSCVSETFQQVCAIIWGFCFAFYLVECSCSFRHWRPQFPLTIIPWWHFGQWKLWAVRALISFHSLPPLCGH